MLKTADQIALEVKNYIFKWNKPYSSWYVGITAEPDKRVFIDHGVRKDNGHGWIYRECQSSNDARNIEAYFINSLGTKGDVGGGDDNSNFVYAYEITNYTNEEA